MHVVGRRLLGACISVLVACVLFVACRSSSSASAPTREAAVAVHAASVLLHGVSECVCVCVFGYVVFACGCLRLLVVVTFSACVVVAVVGGCCCCCCGCCLWLLLCLWAVCLCRVFNFTLEPTVRVGHFTISRTHEKHIPQCGITVATSLLT